jgi:hypothetical protein
MVRAGDKAGTKVGGVGALYMDGIGFQEPVKQRNDGDSAAVYPWDCRLPKSRLEAQRSSVVPWTNEVDFAVSKVGLKELWTLNWHRQFNIVNGWTKAGGIQPQNWPAWMQGFKDY